MADATVIEREALLDNEVAEREAREAAEDLERIEEDAKREAEAYVEVKDLDGDEKASVEAAGSAFDFSQAEIDTAMITGQVEEDLDWGDDASDDEDASEDW